MKVHVFLAQLESLPKRNNLFIVEILKRYIVKQKRFKLILFFIPYHHIGGAERVHLEIIKSLKYKPIVIFDRTDGTVLSKEYLKNAHCFFVTNQKRKKILIYLIQIISYLLPLTLFGCNSGFYYQILSKIKNNVTTIDLTHAFSFPEHGMEITSLKYIHLLDNRVVINNKTLEDYQQLYAENNIDDNYLDRFKVIPNGVQIGEFMSDTIFSRFNDFTIGFVGRNSKEKRPEVFFELVNCIENSNVKAKVIGDNFNDFKENYKQVKYFEGCNSPELVRKEFSEISLLIIPSSREGFPLVIMEAMELGIPVISINVGSVSEHVINDLNGYLSVDNSESEFIKFALNKILLLSSNKELYSRLSINAREYAVNNFDLDTFQQKYRSLFYD
ncbi:glycosyltransferase family 4 protein [Flavobacterium gawalongense]|uniref:Glycosyltransferase family 4 protein n=1 Tax=Flavobacterium gawalongense TaxID=2594432 RepID=A0A553BZ17_9FLAO|nr:glycosyltransferase family 4 protein [Flavobacterium gawalongense]TRX15594.1 glycosyltransferase family 4 protein [Flavobacterium gawalongense]TRX31432.1 glycosyltransferase family 4 protein [Flavobacterium gawalongense]